MFGNTLKIWYNCAIKDFFDVQYSFATLRDKIFITKTTNYDDSLVYFKHLNQNYV